MILFNGLRIRNCDSIPWICGTFSAQRWYTKRNLYNSHGRNSEPNLRSDSDEKSVKYNEILQKLGLLEQKGMWAEDVKNLRESLKASYEQGFNVMTIKSLSQFDDEQTGRKT